MGAQSKPIPPQGKKLRVSYTQESLLRCASLVLSGTHTPAEARHLIRCETGEEIPKGTLSGYTKGKKNDGTRVVYDKDSQHGAPTFLSHEDEQRIYNLIVRCDELGCCIGRDDIRATAAHLDAIKAECDDIEPKFGENGPSDEWLTRYMQEWKLSERITLDKEPKRTTALNATVVNETFELWDRVRATGESDQAPPPPLRPTFVIRNRCIYYYN